MKRRAVLIVVALVLLVTADLRRAPADQWTAHLTVSAIHGYQATLSKWYGRMGVQCRFSPTCSHYSEECVRRFGAARGSWLAMKRVLRCGPWTPLGTLDPPPTT